MQQHSLVSFGHTVIAADAEESSPLGHIVVLFLRSGNTDDPFGIGRPFFWYILCMPPDLLIQLSIGI